ncbi:MAG: SUMF1/EgtB/PvdO family nonheme iron enzyme [Sorangiineae bacterium]|nr:SUMF1/EgtB/PvdO family nonheme iron enzyme [Sorangiineae bacterium]
MALRRYAGVSAALVVLSFALGCEKIIGLEDFSAAGGPAGSAGMGRGGAAGSGGGSGGGAGGTTADAGCPEASDPGAHGPAMARVVRPDGTCFWIDSTEVTVSQYVEFLAASPGPQDGVCAWNTSDGGSGDTTETPGFAPSATCSGVDGGLEPDAGDGNLPITCVDWCDALAFCVWANKDLCRDDGNALPDPTKSDFVQACTAGKPQNLYGCSGTSPSVCNGASSGNKDLLPVAASTGCSVTGAESSSSISDLSGNAAEWTNFCSPNTPKGNCLTRGGSYNSGDSQLQCVAGVSIPRTATQRTQGFRCCAP